MNSIVVSSTPEPINDFDQLASGLYSIVYLPLVNFIVRLFGSTRSKFDWRLDTEHLVPRLQTQHGIAMSTTSTDSEGHDVQQGLVLDQVPSPGPIGSNLQHLMSHCERIDV